MKVTLLSKLAVDKDRRTFTPEAINVGRFSFLKERYAKYSSQFMKLNLIFFVFWVPLVACMFILPSLFRQTVISAYNFSGSLGIGYPGNSDSLVECKNLLYDKYFYVVLIAAACVWFAGTFSSGLFYGTRNAYWAATLRPLKDFFKGVGMFILPFTVAFLILAGFIILDGYLVIEIMRDFAAGHQRVWTWICIIFAAAATIYYVMNLVVFLPMLSAYRFKIKDSIKNAFILTLTYWLPTLLIALVTLAFFALLLTGTMFKMIVVLTLILGASTVICLAWTTFAHYTFDSTIAVLYNRSVSEQKKKDKKNKNKKK